MALSTTPPGKTAAEQLANITGAHYLGVEAINKGLGLLSGDRIEIPEHETRRLGTMMPKNISDETIGAVRRLQGSLEGEQSLVIAQLPKQIIKNRSEVTLGITSTQEMINQHYDQGGNNIGCYNLHPYDYENADYIGGAHLLERSWGDYLTVWALDCIQESQNKTYSEQQDIRNNAVRASCQAGLGIVIVTALLESLGERVPADQMFMRLDTNYFNAMYLFVIDGKYRSLRVVRGDVYDEFTGIGAALEINNEGSIVAEANGCQLYHNSKA